MRHPQPTLCCSQKTPGLLDVFWGCTDGRKAPAGFWTASAISSVCFQCCQLLGFAQLFLQGCPGCQSSSTGASGGALLLLLGCVEEPCCCWAHWAHSTGPHCAADTWGWVQMRFLSWELGWVTAQSPHGAAVGISGCTGHVLGLWAVPGPLTSSPLPFIPQRLGRCAWRPQKVFAFFVPLQYFSTVFVQCCSLRD